MKKLLALVLAMMMVLSLAACGSSKNNSGTPSGDDAAGVDLSKYPANLSDWSAQNVLDYFKEAVEFPDGWTDMYSEESWIATPVHDGVNGWTADGSIMFRVYTFDPNAADTTPEAVEEWLDIIRSDSTHMYADDEFFIGPASHLAGNILFCYEMTTDDTYYDAFEAAYQQLVSAFGVTPDF